MIRIIDKIDYNASKAPVLFSDEEYSHSYALLLNNEAACFRLAWSSSLIEPVLTEINHNTFAVGIDQHFAIINFETNEIVLNLDLMYYFMNSYLYKDSIFVATQMEIIRINKDTLHVTEEYALPDFFNEISFTGNTMTVTCMSGIEVEHQI